MLADAGGGKPKNPKLIGKDSDKVWNGLQTDDTTPVKDPTIGKPIYPRLRAEISYAATEALGIKLACAIFVNKETLETNVKSDIIRKTNMYQKQENGRYKETVTGANTTNILNFDYQKKVYALPAKLKIKTNEPIMKGIEVFKFNDVIDGHAVLRIRIFKNSGDGYARTQQEINEAGAYYKKILIDGKENQTDKNFLFKNKYIMKNILIILFALMFNVHKSIAQDTTLINTFNTLISNVDTGFSVDTTSTVDNIDSVQIDTLNKFYFVKGTYTDTTDGDTRYGKIYVLKYDHHKFLIIDSTSRFIYFKVSFYIAIHKDSLFIHFEARRISNDYTYVFNRRQQTYQLVSFSSYSFRDVNNLNCNYDIKKQLLSWKITGAENSENANYKESRTKKIILPKNFPIQLRKFDDGMFMYDCAAILNQADK